MSLDARGMGATERLAFLTGIRRMLALGDVTPGEALRVLRAAHLGVERARFSKMVGVSMRELAKIEGGTANSTVATLDRVFAPFGMRVGLVATRPDRGESPVPPLTAEGYAEMLDAVRDAVARHSRRRQPPGASE